MWSTSTKYGSPLRESSIILSRATCPLDTSECHKRCGTSRTNIIRLIVLYQTAFALKCYYRDLITYQLFCFQEYRYSVIIHCYSSNRHRGSNACKQKLKKKLNFDEILGYFLRKFWCEYSRRSTEFSPPFKRC